MIQCRLVLQAKLQRSGGTDCDFYILAIINTGTVPICAIKRLVIPGKYYVVGQGVLYFGFRKGTLGRHVVNSYHFVSINEGGVYSHKFLPSLTLKLSCS